MMKSRLITLLLVTAAAFLFAGEVVGQTNATFSTIDVRTRETFRGPFYNYDTTFFKPSSTNIPFLADGEPLGWFLSTSKGAEAKLVRVTIDQFRDTLLSNSPFVRDTTNGFIYQAVLTDKVGLGTATPSEMLDVVGNINLPTTTAAVGQIKFNGIKFISNWDAQIRIGNGHNLTSTGDRNLIIGNNNTGQALTTGSDNIAIGDSAMAKSATGTLNTFIGNWAGAYNSKNIGVAPGSNNVAIGHQALRGGSPTLVNTANKNVAIGYQSMMGTVGTAQTGVQNVSIGYQAGLDITTGSNNVLLGNSTGNDITTGGSNMLIGTSTGAALTTASQNILIGYASGSLLTGDSNIFIGSYSGATLTTVDNRLVVDNTNTTTPLLEGNFLADTLRVNGGFKAIYDNIYFGYKANPDDGATRSLYSAIIDDTISIIESLNTDDEAAYNYNMGIVNSIETSTAVVNLAAYDTSDYATVNVAAINLSQSSQVFTTPGYIMISSDSVSIEGKVIFSNDATIGGNLTVSGSMKSGTGTIANNDATPDVSGYNTFIYDGTANSVAPTDLDNPVVGAYYTFIGNSDTYTLNFPGSTNFKMSGAGKNLGQYDNITFYCQADNLYIMVGYNDITP